MTFSRPTIAAKRRMRSATSCGCSTRLVAWLTTPGISMAAALRSATPAIMLVAHIGGLEGIGLRLHLEDQIDDVLERQIMGMRPVPAAPAQVIAHLILGNAGEQVVDGVDAPPG